MLVFSGGGSITVLATVLGVSAPANAIVFNTFSDRASWEAAVGGSFSEEDFNSFTVDTSFDGVNVDVGDFTLNGTSQFSGFQQIDFPPITASGVLNIDGTTQMVAATGSSSNFSFTFDSPITAFGASFNELNSSNTQLSADSDIVPNLPTVAGGTPGGGFFGFVADGNFTTVTFDSVTGSGDGFGMDNVVYDSSTASVPFEFSPALGLLAVGSVWGVSRLRKRLAASKITK